MAQRKNDREARQARERLRAYQARQAVHTRATRRRRRDNLVAGIGILVVAIVAVGAQLLYFGVGPGKPAPKPVASASATPTPTPSPSATQADEGPVPSAKIADDRTWHGTLTLNKTIRLGFSLDGKAAPQAVSSTIHLIRSGFYKGTLCHRLTTLAKFKVLQCGGAKTLAAAPNGGPGYSYGPIENAPTTPDSTEPTYQKGVIAMARSTNDAYSQGSQFFIVYGASTIASDNVGGYTVIGRITSGLGTLIKDVTSKGSDNSTATGDGHPKVSTAITSVTVQ